MTILYHCSDTKVVTLHACMHADKMIRVRAVEIVLSASRSFFLFSPLNFSS